MGNHSPVGGSAAARFIACPGSVKLIEATKDIQPEEDDTYSAPGTVAHSIAEQCLLEGKEPWQFIRKVLDGGIAVDKEMADAVTEYLEYVRSYVSEKDKVFVEHRFHCPGLHEHYVGTADFVILRKKELHVIDYKHGAGLSVSPKENPQLMYYAAGVLESLNLWGTDMNIVLHIVQPRKKGGGGKWVTNTEQLDAWLWGVLIPAMEQAFTKNAPVNAGEHCRFCDVRSLKCPGIMRVIKEVEELMNKGVDALSNEEVGRLLDLEAVFKIAKTAALKTATARIQLGQTVPGWKLVKARALRAWKPGAEGEIKEKFGGRAYAPAKLKSPAQIEKLSGGKEIVKELAVTPDKGMTLAPDNDAREAPANASVMGVFTDHTKGKSK